MKESVKLMKKIMYSLTFAFLGAVSMSAFTPEASAVRIENTGKSRPAILTTSNWYDEIKFGYETLLPGDSINLYQPDRRGNLIAEHSNGNYALYYVSGDARIGINDDNGKLNYYDQKNGKSLSELDRKSVPDGLHKDVEVTNTSSNFYTVSVSRSHESQNGNYFTMMPGESKNWARSYQGTDPYEPSRFYIMTVTSHLSEKAYLVKAGNRIVIDNDGVPREKLNNGVFPELNL
ncbi:hypothetical protein [Enterococcus faecalis]|uniref:hypothetical protein n=2 Tax=Enterococcus faecalis TaxID=1351 RepID=UPI00242E3EF3|nr:hypothetical protein [Enterococcus faecalis]